MEGRLNELALAYLREWLCVRLWDYYDSSYYDGRTKHLKSVVIIVLPTFLMVLGVGHFDNACIILSSIS